MDRPLVWFDIPVHDLDRAIAFYSAILGEPVERQEFPEVTIGLLPHAHGEISGCLFVREGETPGDHGPLLYFNADGRLDEAIEAVESNGGQGVLPQHAHRPLRLPAPL